MFEVIVLDAMGVMYADADDVGQVLLPFLAERNLIADRSVVEPLYLACSSGDFNSAELWRRLGARGDVSALDDEYVRGYRLNRGVHEFIDRMASTNRRIAALTNDTSAWSLCLRRRFAIERRIDPWIVSGDVGHRKPSKEIYQALLEAVPAVRPQSMLFVDDRRENLDAAAEHGIGTMLFGHESSGGHAAVRDFAGLLRFVTEH